MDWDRRIEREMVELAQEARIELKTIVNPECADQFANLLAWAYREEENVAEDIVKRLDIKEKHLAAILNDEEWLQQQLEAEDVNDYLTSVED